MKHYLRNIMLIGGIVFQTALCGVTAEDFILHEGEVKTIEVDQNHTFSKAGRIGGAINAKKFSLEKNSKLNIQGEIFEEVKNIRGIYIEGKKFGVGNPGIKEGASLSMNIAIDKEKQMLKGDVPVEGMYISSKAPKQDKFQIDKNGKLDIVVHANQFLEREENLTGDHENKKDLFHQLLKKSIGLSFDTNIKNYGELKIESTGTGIKKGARNSGNHLEFENDSKTYIKAGLIGIFAPESKIFFKKGSYAKLVGGAYGIIAAEANFEEGSKVKAMGKYGFGNYIWKGKGDQFRFKSGSEVDILANEAAFYAISLHGKTKARAKAKNLFLQANTKIEGVETNLDTFTFEKESLLEGNISKSWYANITMEEGVKFFVENEIQANLLLKGDLYVGPREAYENIKRKSYKDEIKDLDAKAGASVILLGKLKEQSLEDLKARLPYEKASINQYYMVNYNIDEGNRKTIFTLDNSKIHLRVGGKWKNNTSLNDKLFLAKNTSINGTGAEIVIHPTNVSGIQRNMTFDLLEEEKKMETGEFDLEGMKISLSETELGPLVFARKDRKLEDRYIISLSDTGKLSKAAIQSMNLARDSHEWNMKELQGIQHTIFAKKDQELRENFWILSSHENFINKETDRKWKQNSLYAGYDYTFSPKLSLGFFAGQSTGGMKSIAQGIYFRKSLAPFYVGGMVKRTELKQEEKRNHSGDISFIVGHVWDKKSKLYVNNSFALTRGHVSSSQYIEGNGMHTEREKFNYVDGEFHSRLGYNFTDGSLFMEVGLGKHILGKQRILWNGNVQEELKHDGLRKRIGIGGQWKIKHHGIDMKISKEYSKYYKSNMKVSLGYSYSF
ncbi:autotransporter outer membrane beta-barrel domain-containing protein [Fusobacterium necrophorum]|uniref:autotransporter outer membrane beta-barrel domain-containing protein n=1 Tax=Fusobacterium necrophorum TaxID=859 RepID=UPI00048859C4|nr:autotransporter outer membrane beta-barrel domain-containing protein [Fusobacterium necrophorum]